MKSLKPQVQQQVWSLC